MASQPLNPHDAENTSLSVRDDFEDSVTENRDLSAVPDNFKPHVFKPGQSGNPGGRPKKITKVIDKLLDQPYESGRSYLQAFAEETLKRAITRSDFMAKEIFERIEGKVPQAITGADGGPVQFQVAVVYGSMETPDETQGITDCDAQVIENKQEPS